MSHGDRYAEFDYSHLVDWQARLAREWPFLENILCDAPSRRLVDLGSGTGEHARFLAEKGFSVVGVDASPAMLAKSREVASTDDVTFVEGDMRDLGGFAEASFGGAICLGNALPHLTGSEDLTLLATSLRRVLQPGSPFVLQLLNYDRIEARRERALPITYLPDPQVPGATIVFLRTMELLPDGRVIFMPTRLRQRADSDPPLELIGSRRVEIRGWRAGEIVSAFVLSGFPKVSLFGSFGGEPFLASESRDVLLVAR